MFVVAVALLYGSTLAPSPRDGVQPVEWTDLAFYAVLGRDLATTGTETNTSPSGFTDLPGLPAQTWYHWGELWLASAVITIFGTAPLPRATSSCCPSCCSPPPRSPARSCGA